MVPMGMGETGGSWLSLDNVFWATLLLIFAVAIVGAFVGRRRRDRCLRLLDDYRVTCLREAAPAAWGDLRVTGQGLELIFDSPTRASRGMPKASEMIYQEEIENLVAIARSVHALSPHERERRLVQVRRTTRPGAIRRARRSLQNAFNTLRDAVVQAMSLAVGRFGAGALGGAIRSRQADVSNLGRQVVGLVANAYEPLLERHIGRPVVLELACPGVGTVEFSGFLAEYSDKFIALFSPEQEAIERIELQIGQAVERPGLKAVRDTHHVVLTCTGPDLLVVREIVIEDRAGQPNVVLVPGCSLEVSHAGSDPVRVSVEQTRCIDLVCPRSRATVRFGGVTPDR